MNLTFHCPRCDQPGRVEVPDGAASVACPHCAGAMSTVGSLDDGRVSRCIVCASGDLFVRKDFPQRLGVAIVVVGFVGSSVAWYFYRIYMAFAILFATALLDILLYQLVGFALVCYRCHAHYRGVRGLDSHSPFSLETHERYRQQAARPQRSDLGETTRAR
jgi:hypothetical protein